MKLTQRHQTYWANFVLGSLGIETDLTSEIMSVMKVEEETGRPKLGSYVIIYSLSVSALTLTSSLSERNPPKLPVFSHLPPSIRILPYRNAFGRVHYDFYNPD